MGDRHCAGERLRASRTSERVRAYQIAYRGGVSRVRAALGAGDHRGLGPGLRVAKAMLSAMARGDSSSAALATALESEPVDLAEQTERVEAAHRAIRATSSPEDAALLPRFGDSLAPAQVRADRALALLARLRDELSSPPLPVTPARTPPSLICATFAQQKFQFYM